MVEMDNLFSGLGVKKKVAIFTHSTPDPDSIGSAVGMQWLLAKKYSLVADIFHMGEISHSENRTMCNVLSVVMYPAADFEKNKDDYERVIVVDATLANVGVPGLAADMIVDHHDIKSTKEEAIVLSDIRPLNGSSCSIVYEYIEKSGCEFTMAEEDKIVATAMLYGIRKDTDVLVSEKVSELDFHAYQALTKFIDKQKISLIQAYPHPSYFWELECQVIRSENITQVNTAYIVYAGIVAPLRRDFLPYFADKLYRLEGVSTSIVFAIVGEAVEVSVRTSDVSLNLGSFLEKMFGKEFSGAKSKSGQGGAKIPLGLFSLTNVDDPEVRKNVSDAVEARFTHLVTKELSGD